MTSIKKIKEELKGVNRYEVVIYGSFVRKNSTSKSDIDVAVISREKDRGKNRKLWYELLSKAPYPYELKIFELLSLPIQIEIINNYKVIFGDSLEISEYFYNFRRLWKDTEKRYCENQFHSVKEKMSILQRN